MDQTAITTTAPGEITPPPANIPGDVKAGAITREEFGAREMQVLGETAVTASAAAVKAEIEAAFIVAMNRPRNMDVVFERIMRDCKRPGFAEAAVYRLPRGGKTIKGLSIRFAESAVRAMGNAVLKAQTLYDDDDKQLVQVVGIDLETNTRFEESVIVSKTIERRVVKEGTRVLGSRRNSEGQVVYIVAATDDEMRMKRGAEVARGRRNVALQLIPGDITQDAMRACEATMLNRAQKDPDAERKALILAFSDLGVSADQLKEYLGHDLAGVQPAELVELRQTWKAISDGQTNWRDVLAEKAAELARESAKDDAQAGGKKSATERLKGKVAAANTPAPAPREPGDDSDGLQLK